MSDPTVTTAPVGPVGGYTAFEPTESAILACAVLCHAVTKALNDSRNEYTLSWELSRDSAVSGVKAILENPKLAPSESHEKWLAYKEKEGWVYGTAKDPKAKTHPCMLPYAALPENQKMKDLIFGAVVRAFFGL